MALHRCEPWAWFKPQGRTPPRAALAAPHLAGDAPLGHCRDSAVAGYMTGWGQRGSSPRTPFRASAADCWCDGLLSTADASAEFRLRFTTTCTGTSNWLRPTERPPDGFPVTVEPVRRDVGVLERLLADAMPALVIECWRRPVCADAHGGLVAGNHSDDDVSKI